MFHSTLSHLASNDESSLRTPQSMRHHVRIY
ncbi:hypothetical protein WG66_004500 [Moniliophthora roreri]|nr:hypothetical protein WG66_004500 [Moniliophthora roreri]